MDVRPHWAIILLLLATFAGCETQGDRYYLKGFAPTSEDQLKRAVSEDPDLRAQAITDWSNKDWGRRGAYVEFYATALQHDDHAIVRCAAARALGRCGDPKQAPTLAAALRDADAAVRWDAAVALDQVIGPAAVEPLRRAAASDTSVNVRVAALRALRHYPEKPVLETLLRCLGDQPFDVGFQAHESLVEITAQDAGYDGDKWAAILARPLPKKKADRPWWDWFGTTQQPATAPASAPAGRRP